MSSECSKSSGGNDTVDTQSCDDTSSFSTEQSSDSSCSSSPSLTVIQVNNQINISNSTAVHVGRSITSITQTLIDPNSNILIALAPVEFEAIRSIETDPNNCKTPNNFLGRTRKILRNKSTLNILKIRTKYVVRKCIKEYWYYIVFLLIAVAFLSILGEYLITKTHFNGGHQRPQNTTTTPKTTDSEITVRPTVAIIVEPDSYLLVSRKNWGGRSLERTKTREHVRAITLLLNVTGSETCDTLEQCEKVLHQLENNSGKPLNFNFLMDTSGILYEGRGWSHMADEEYLSSDIIKIGFIGPNVRLNSKQINRLRRFIESETNNFSTILSIIPQCCRDMLNEATYRYGSRQACDLF